MIRSIAPPFGHDDATVALRSFPSWNRILGGEAGRWNPRAATIPCPGAPTFLLFCYGVHLVAVLFGPVRAMSTYLEVQGPEGSKLLNLLGDRVSVGKDPSNELAVPSDPSVSRLHAVLERFPAGWCIRDLDSRNGTFVNGARIWGERPLHPGDEIRVGSTTLVFRYESSRPLPSTDAPLPVPGLTRRERDVLVALCRPLASGDVFTEPASVRTWPRPWLCPRPRSNSTWPTCTTSSASTKRTRDVAFAWPTRPSTGGWCGWATSGHPDECELEGAPPAFAYGLDQVERQAARVLGKDNLPAGMDAQTRWRVRFPSASATRALGSLWDEILRRNRRPHPD